MRRFFGSVKNSSSLKGIFIINVILSFFILKLLFISRKNICYRLKALKYMLIIIVKYQYQTLKKKKKSYHSIYQKTHAIQSNTHIHTRNKITALQRIIKLKKKMLIQESMFKLLGRDPLPYVYIICISSKSI